MINCKHFLIIPILLALQVYQSEAQCNFTKEELSLEERLIVEHKDNAYQLLREVTLKEGTVLYMICENDDVIKMQCCNGSTSGDMFRLPLTVTCTHPLRARAEVVKDKACPYETYSVRYSFTLNKKAFNLEIYRVCFDKAKMRTIYTANEVYPNFLPRPKNVQFRVDEIFTPYYFNAYSNREVFKTLETLLGSGQNYMVYNESHRRIDRGHLMAAADAMTNNMMRSTFKMINVIPQYHSVNAGNWKTLEEWVRKPFNRGSKVCSGAFDRVLTLNDHQQRPVKIYLRDGKIPIPLWTFKIVRHSDKKRTAFLQYNNIHDEKFPPSIPKEYNCKAIDCPDTLNLNLRNNQYGYTFCCDPKQFMKGRLKQLDKHC